MSAIHPTRIGTAEARRARAREMSHSLEALLVGRTLAERYLIEEVIGRGGMSIVYRARDERLGRPIAVKIVALPAAETDQRLTLRERFRREAGSAARIPPHPNVVQVYDYGTDPALDLDYIVMELLQGRDLKAAIRKRDLGDAEALRVIREAARGVAAGHRAGIVHRDVKPANIFLTGNDRLESVKILDFGIAKAQEFTGEEDLTLAGQLPHSPGYASPEQQNPGQTLTPASDVYQLGLLAYELFTGEKPFDERQRERIGAGEHVALPSRGEWGSLSPDLRQAIERALSPRPADRFPDASTFAEALSRVSEWWRLSDDARLLVPHEDDHTVIAPAHLHESMPRRSLQDSAPVHAVPPQSPRQGDAGIDNVRSRPRFAWTPGQLGKFAAGVALVVLGLWGTGLIGRGGAAADDDEGLTLDVGALELEFQALYHRAYRNLLDAGAAQEGDAAAAAVRRVIEDAQDAYIRGDLDRHISHYAERVNYHNRNNVARSQIERDRRADFERYSRRDIALEGEEIEFPQPRRARALLDRSWTFSGPSETWSGTGQQELILELQSGRWRIVSERDLEIFSSTRLNS
ncbi:hypothetical protein BH23GEM6_BH23GEM6_26300 [soil metagenome]